MMNSVLIARRSIICHWQMTIFFSTRPIMVNNFIFPRVFYFICWCMSCLSKKPSQKRGRCIYKALLFRGKIEKKDQITKTTNVFITQFINFFFFLFSIFSGSWQLPTIKWKIPLWERNFTYWGLLVNSGYNMEKQFIAPKNVVLESFK